MQQTRKTVGWTTNSKGELVEITIEDLHTLAEGIGRIMKKEKVRKPMRKNQLLDHLAQELDISKRQVRFFLETLRDTVYSELRRTRTFILPDLGKFTLKDTKARMGRNPRTGEKVKIAAKLSLRFRVAKSAKVGAGAVKP